jgi:hypothetical protein
MATGAKGERINAADGFVMRRKRPVGPTGFCEISRRQRGHQRCRNEKPSCKTRWIFEFSLRSGFVDALDITAGPL